MTTTTRTAALGALAALMLAIGSPQDSAAHATLTEEQRAGTAYTHGPQPPENFRVQRLASSPHNAIVVSWDESHLHPVVSHRRFSDGYFAMMDYRIVVSTELTTREDGYSSSLYGSCPNAQPPLPEGCFKRIVTAGNGRHSTTFTGLRPDTSYSVGMIGRYSRSDDSGSNSGQTTATLAIITTASPPGASTASHSHPVPEHSHRVAPHSHSDLKHGHPFARAGHSHATGAHTHSYAATDHAHTEVPDHTHDGSTGTTPGASTTAAQTCPRFIELVSPFAVASGIARELVTGSVWIAVDAIEYMRERTVRAESWTGHDEAEGVEIRLKEFHGPVGAGTRSFILDGAILADVAASVRCQSAPVAVTTEDPPTPAPE